MKRALTILGCVLLVLCLSGCGKKEGVTSANFKSILSNNGFTVSNITELVESNNLKQVLTADNDKYQIEYYVFDTENDAITSYKANKKIFADSKQKNSKEKITSGTNYNKYTLVLTSTYDCVARYKNTLIYISANKDFKGDINKMVNKLGY